MVGEQKRGLICPNIDLPPIIGDGYTCQASYGPPYDYAIRDGFLCRNGEKYAKINSHNEETGEYAATVISDNQFLNETTMVFNIVRK